MHSVGIIFICLNLLKVLVLSNNNPLSSHIAEILGTKKLKKEKRKMAKKVDFYHSWLLSEKTENLEFRVVMSKKLLEKEFKSFQNDEKIISEKMKSTVLIEPVTDNPKLIIEVEYSITKPLILRYEVVFAIFRTLSGRSFR